MKQVARLGIQSARANEGPARNPPKGKFLEGVLYVAAKAATHKATGKKALSRDPQSHF
jgi:hypothetical protein